MADSLSAILHKVRSSGNLTGVVPHLIPGGVSHLQYANDTVLLFQPDAVSLAMIKIILICFEAMSGMRINFAKSEVFTVGMSSEDGARIANLLNRKKAKLPMTYVGLPCSDRALI